MNRFGWGFFGVFVFVCLFLVATTAVALQQRCHMDPLYASVSTLHLCATSALWLLGVTRSSCRLNQLLACSKLDQALFCWTNVCRMGNLAATSVSREITCKPADGCWEIKAGAELQRQLREEWRPSPCCPCNFLQIAVFLLWHLLNFPLAVGNNLIQSTF